MDIFFIIILCMLISQVIILFRLNYRRDKQLRDLEEKCLNLQDRVSDNLRWVQHEFQYVTGHYECGLKTVSIKDLLRAILKHLNVKATSVVVPSSIEVSLTED